MRIIGGQFKGHRLSPQMKKWPTRPTTDFAKEALYNILQNKLDFEEVAFLDLFGGVGSHTLEFASRGCSAITYVERFGACVDFVANILRGWGIEGVSIVKGDAFKYIERSAKDGLTYDVIFADPPYDHKGMGSLPDLILKNNLLNQEGQLIIEHDSKTSFDKHPYLRDHRTYGGCHFSFFSSS